MHVITPFSASFLCYLSISLGLIYSSSSLFLSKAFKTLFLALIILPLCR
jgi:hypothetical protein